MGSQISTIGNRPESDQRADIASVSQQGEQAQRNTVGATWFIDTWQDLCKKFRSEFLNENLPLSAWA